MGNHTDILKKIMARIEAFEKAGGDMEEDLWPSAETVVMEIKQIIDAADPPLETSASSQ